MLLHNALEIYPEGFSVLEELNYYYVANYTLMTFLSIIQTFYVLI